MKYHVWCVYEGLGGLDVRYYVVNYQDHVVQSVWSCKLEASRVCKDLNSNDLAGMKRELKWILK